MYQVLIVEDEREAAERLRAALDRYATERGIELRVTWLTSAMELDERGRDADLIFLDIELPHVNGMDAAADFRTHDQTTPIIFVTNLAQYAVRGYQVDALDFIVKPFTYYDFALRMDRAMQVVRRNVGRALVVKARDGMHAFPASDLVFLDVSGHDVVYHLASGERIAVRGSLSQAEADLGGSPFLRVSSGCVINMAHVRGLRDAELVLSTGDVVWASRANKRRVVEELARYLGGDA